jgi:hypothetical protein
VEPPKLMGRVGMDALPYRMGSGDYHKMVIKISMSFFDGSGSEDPDPGSRPNSEAPIRRMARWGLHVKIHTTSFIK